LFLQPALRACLWSLRHICTRKGGVSGSRLDIACEDAGGGDLLPFLTALDIIKHINLMADPERFETTITFTRCKMQKALFRLQSDYRKKETATGPMRKHCQMSEPEQTWMFLTSSDDISW